MVNTNKVRDSTSPENLGKKSWNSNSSLEFENPCFLNDHRDGILHNKDGAPEQTVEVSVDDKALDTKNKMPCDAAVINVVVGECKEPAELSLDGAQPTLTVNGHHTKQFTNSPRAHSRMSLISITEDITKKSWRERNAGWITILAQMGVPFLIAGLGMVLAGVLLDNAMEWEVFKEVGELVILVTPLLGLKGDLEMTLASRLSTHANIGNMDNPRTKWKICAGNLCLDQLQAIVCGLVAAFIAMGMGAAVERKIMLDHVILLCSASIITASMVSVVLGSTMVTVILVARRFKINPDNIATPVAGSMGDLVTLGILSLFAKFIWNEMKASESALSWAPLIIFFVYTVVMILCFIAAYKNRYTREVLITGWVPVIVSVIISTGGGILLDMAGNRYESVGLYQPLINGIGGNLVSVQASRISTSLHKFAKKGVLPDDGSICESPFSVFFSSGPHAMSARLLIFMSIPGHIIFTAVAHFINGPSNDPQYGWMFLILFLLASVMQIAVLLYSAKILTNLCWKRNMDPDTSSIPYLTALGDLFGSGFLFIAFELLKQWRNIIN